MFYYNPCIASHLKRKTKISVRQEKSLCLEASCASTDLINETSSKRRLSTSQFSGANSADVA